MKAMKYILMVISMVSVLSISAQPQTEQPQIQFQSTSTLQGSGSTYAPQPSINADGTAYNPTVSSTGRTGGGPRRDPGVREPGEDDVEQPIGDAVLPLMIMALAFGGVIWLRRRRVAKR